MLRSKHSLERHKFFPIIAWTVVVGFSLFVYTIAQDLQTTSRELGETTTRLEKQLRTPPEGVKNLVDSPNV